MGMAVLLSVLRLQRSQRHGRPSAAGLPVGEPIRFYMRTLDVIHALWFPQVRYKHDLIPGSTQVVTLSFPAVGR